MLQFSIAACNILLRQYLFLQHVYSIVTKFPLSRQIFLWLFNTLSCKVCRFVYYMSQHSHACLLEQLCCDFDNCVTTLFLCSFLKIASLPSFYIAIAFLLVLVATMFLVLSVFLSRLGKSVVIESCHHLT